jgi:hypothetical protein
MQGARHSGVLELSGVEGPKRRGLLGAISTSTWMDPGKIRRAGGERQQQHHPLYFVRERAILRSDGPLYG